MTFSAWNGEALRILTPKKMEIGFDFSELFYGRGDYPDKVSQKEIQSVYENPKCRISELLGFPKDQMYHIACGYSSSKRVLLIASMFSTGKVKILQVKVASETDIEDYFCRR